MKYLFILRFLDCTSQRIYEDCECDADAMMRSREILKDWRAKRDDVTQIDLFHTRRFENSWICDDWIISYC